MSLPGLEARLRKAIAISTAGRIVPWAAVSLIAWSIANLLFMLFSPPATAVTGLALFLASILPAFAFWPVPDDLLRKTLREADENSVFEALLEPVKGPALELLVRRAVDLDGGLPFRQAPRRPLFRFSGKLAALALFAFACLELVSLLVLRRPAFIYPGPPPALASGLRIDDPSFPAPGQGDGAVAAPKETPARPDPTSADFQALRAKRAESQAETDIYSAAGNAGTAMEKGQAAAAPERREPPASPSSPQDGHSPAAPSAGKKGEAHNLSGGDRGEPGKAEGNPNSRGFAGSAGSLPPSPLVDYRARIFLALTASGGKDVRAGEGLDLAKLRNYERRFFGSFALPLGAGPREDAWSLLVKRRWREGAGASR